MSDYVGHRNDSWAKLAGSGTDEVQSVTVDGTAGTYTLEFKGETSAAIDFDATASELKAALELLDTIDEVTVTGGPGDDGGTSPYVVTFGGFNGGQDQPLLVADDAGLTGTGVTVAVVTEGVAPPVAPADAPGFDASEYADQPGAAARALGYPRTDGRSR